MKIFGLKQKRCVRALILFIFEKLNQRGGHRSSLMLGHFPKNSCTRSIKTIKYRNTPKSFCCFCLVLAIVNQHTHSNRTGKKHANHWRILSFHSFSHSQTKLTTFSASYKRNEFTRFFLLSFFALLKNKTIYCHYRCKVFFD